MHHDADRLLSDEFVAFSQKIAELHTKKKAKKQELKTIYDQYQADIKVLEDEAQKLAKEFETGDSCEEEIVEDTSMGSSG